MKICNFIVMIYYFLLSLQEKYSPDYYECHRTTAYLIISIAIQGTKLKKVINSL